MQVHLILGHFLCSNLAPARNLQEVCKSCKAHASFLQDLLALRAQFTRKSSMNLARLARKQTFSVQESCKHGLARIADNFSLG